MKPEIMWAFAWTSGQPYITSVIHWTRKDVLRDIEKANDLPWKKIYRRGGRIIKVKVSPA